jgi:hypothetical protein
MAQALILLLSPLRGYENYIKNTIITVALCFPYGGQYLVL